MVRLTKIFRQAAESDIIVNAHKINRGEPVTLDNKSRDFFFLQRQDPNIILRVVLALVQEKMPLLCKCGDFGYPGADPHRARARLVWTI